MGYTKLEVKLHIVFWWNITHSITEAARACGVSYHVARRWIFRYLATNGSVDCVAKPGRRCILTPHAAAMAYNLLVEDKVGTARTVAHELLARGITNQLVHKRTIVRAAKKIAQLQGESIRAVRGKPVKALTAATIQKRLDFCFANTSRTTWRTVMFTDRKRFHFTFPGTSVLPVTWLKRGDQREAYTPNHPLCVNVYAGLTWYGVTKLHIVAGASQHKSLYKTKQGRVARNITQAEYSAVLMQTLLPEGQRIFCTHNVRAWTLQQDNDPAHKNACMVINKYNNEHDTIISMLQNWPPSSPDLSPIENLWAIVQAKLDEKGCKTFEEFQAALNYEWQAVSTKLSVSLIRSVRARIALCIGTGGKRTKY